LIRAYAFPGNVRELQNIVERAVALEPNNMVSAGSLPERLAGGLSSSPQEVVETEAFPTEGLDLEARLAAVERHYVEKAIEAAGGNRTQAAKLLGVSFRSLRYRLIKYGMGSDSDPE
jgi:two-component system response regulator PilR (NtrC family)